MDKDAILAVIERLSLQISLLKLKGKASDRREIIDHLLFDEEGELHQLKELLGLIKN